MSNCELSKLIDQSWYLQIFFPTAVFFMIIIMPLLSLVEERHEWFSWWFVIVFKAFVVLLCIQWFFLDWWSNRMCCLDFCSFLRNVSSDVPGVGRLLVFKNFPVLQILIVEDFSTKTKQFSMVNYCLVTKEYANIRC